MMHGRRNAHSRRGPAAFSLLPAIILSVLLLGGVSHSRAGVFQDDFTGPDLMALWEPYFPKAGPTYSFVNGKLRIEVPGTTSFNHTRGVDSAPQIRFDPPEGNFTLETRVTVPSTTSGSFHAGLFVAFGKNDLFTWGPYRSANQLRLERTGTVLGTLPLTGNAFYLRISKSASNYLFYYKTSLNASWTHYKTSNVPDKPVQIGLIARTIVNLSLRADYDHFKLSASKFNLDLSKGWIRANVKHGSDNVTGPWLIVRNAQGRQVGGFAKPARSGRAAVFNLPAGSYTVKAVHPWVDTSLTQSLNVETGKETAVDLQVVPCPNFSLLSGSKDFPALGVSGGWRLLPGPLGSNTLEYRNYRKPNEESYVPSGTDPTFGLSWVQNVGVPKDYGQSTIRNNSVFWYRLDMTFPAHYTRFKNRTWILSDYNIDDEDRTYFNGTLVGQTYYKPNTQPWREPRDYKIPGELIKPGGKNVLAIQGFQGPGGAGMSLTGPRLRAPSDSTGYVTIRLFGPDGMKADELTVKVTSLGGAYSEETMTEEGRAVFRWLPEGEYLVDISRSAALDPSLPHKIRVLKATFNDFPLTIPVTPYWDLRSEMLDLAKVSGWRFMSIRAAQSTQAATDNNPARIDYPDTGEDAVYGEDWFWDVQTPANLGQGSDPMMPIQNNSYFWYRIHLFIPESWRTSTPGRNLLLSQFRVDDSDWTYFNGTLIGSTNNQAGKVRSYTIPKELVKWGENNVLAIKGYQGIGDAGIMGEGMFTLSMKPLSAPFIPRKGDLNGDDLVDVQDVTLALRIAVSLITAEPIHLAGGDIDGTGEIEVSDAVAILKYIVGLGTL